jgi:hypothetical protein
MADTRAAIASWQSEAIINNELRKESGATSNWQYRNYLTANANEIREKNTTEAFNDIGYYQRFVNPPLEVNSGPFLYSNAYARDQPPGYEDSNLKANYLSREELNQKIGTMSLYVR